MKFNKFEQINTNENRLVELDQRIAKLNENIIFYESRGDKKSAMEADKEIRKIRTSLEYLELLRKRKEAKKAA